MRYENQEIDSVTGKVTSETAFHNIQLSAGKIMSSIYTGELDASDIKLYVLDEDDDVIAEVQEDGTEVEPQHVHDWNAFYTEDIPATCTSDGSESYHCNKCNTIKKGSTRPIPKTGHDYGAWKTTKAATEIAGGQQSRKCSVCGKTETKAVAQFAPTLPVVKISKPK